MEREWHSDRRDKKGAETERVRQPLTDDPLTDGTGGPPDVPTQCGGIRSCAHKGRPRQNGSADGHSANDERLVSTLAALVRRNRRDMYEMLRGRRDHTTLAVLLRGKCGKRRAGSACALKRDLNEVLEKLGDVGWASGPTPWESPRGPRVRKGRGSRHPRPRTTDLSVDG